MDLLCDPMSREELIALLEQTAAKLGEHFDAVQILVSWNENGTTSLAKRGTGNWYARQGMAHEFITSDIAQDTAVQIAERLNPPRDDGEDWKAQQP